MNIRQREIEWPGGEKVRRMRDIRWLRFRRWLNMRGAIGAHHPLVQVAGILALLSLSVWSGPLLRRADTTAGVLDIGILSVLPVALLAVALARLSAVGIYQWMVGPLNELTAWKQALCYGCLYLSHFWAAVWVMARLV